MLALNTLILSLPTRNSTMRMRVWRALKDTGCGVLRDGVYVLPVDAAGSPVLGEMESEIRSAGGFAMTVELKLATAEQAAQVRKLFDRSADYGTLVRRVAEASAALPGLGHRKAQTAVNRMQRSFDELSEIDFFPGQARIQATEAISTFKRRFEDAYSSGEPHAARKRLRRVDPARYRKRTWATRKDLWVDRLASAWLIKRFIDRDAKFAWVDRPRDRPKRSVGFDFDGAEFTHFENRVTFEVLLSSFGLDSDPALAAIGQAVHFLDIGGIPVADARGLETMLRGIKGTARGDDQLAREASKVFDHFYSAYAQENRQLQQPS
ncbi:MAG: chromate resistance protein ChrB domain-containing protein [Burkholderiales bacterium]